LVTLFLVATVILALFGTFELKRILVDKWSNTNKHWLANFGPAIFSALLIIIYGAIYQALAKILTNFENHKS